MVYGVKEFTDVHVQNPRILPTTLTSFANSIMRRAMGTVGIGILMKTRFDRRGYQHYYSHLSYTIRYRRDTQWTFTTSTLRYFYQLHRWRKVTAGTHAIP